MCEGGGLRDFQIKKYPIALVAGAQGGAEFNSGVRYRNWIIDFLEFPAAEINNILRLYREPGSSYSLV